MKKNKKKSLVMTIVFTLATIALIGGLFVKCQKQTETGVSQTTRQDYTEYSLQEVEYPIPENAFVEIQSLRFFDDIKIDDDVKGAPRAIYENLKKEQERLSKYGDVVVPYISTALYYLPKDIKNHDEYFNLIKGDGSEFNILRYTVGEYNEELRASPIINVEVPSESEFNRELDILRNVRIMDNDVFDNSKTLSNTMSLTVANQFFNQFVALSCDSILQCPCLTFQYAKNGCAARAHYMRKLMADAGYNCGKIFAYPDVNSTYQRLNANSNAGCCADWGWHIAPLITTTTGTKMVIDPSICSQPVSITTWKNAMRSNCLNAGVATVAYEIKASSCYGIDSNSQFITDDDYSITMSELNSFATLSGCNGLNIGSSHYVA